MKCYSINTNLTKKDLPILLKKNGRKMEKEILEIYPSMKKHHFYGFGGALTDASGYTLSLLGEEERKKVYYSFFNPSMPVYKYIRIPIDSSDFSLAQHQICHSIEDWTKRRFDFSMEEKYIFPYLDEIYNYSEKELPLLFSPWSPPFFFKKNNSRLRGGQLKKENYQDWAEYISVYLNKFKRHGYNIWGLTIQNEPNAIQKWDSCLYTAEEERAFLLDALAPTLEKNGLSDIRLFYWDHNKERLLSRSHAFLNERTLKTVSGIAFHGYCGDHFAALEVYRKENPQHEVMLSEFCMGIKDKNNFRKQLDVYAHEYINDIAYGADRIIDWNIILEENGGPNHVGNYCMAPYMRNGDKVDSNMAYCVISQLAEKGNDTDVVQTTSFDSSLDCVSFLSKDGQLNLVFRNTKHRKINVRVNNKVFSIIPDANSLVILSLEENDYE